MSKMKMPSKATPFLYGLYKNNNEQMPKAFGKVYARPVVLSTLDTEDIAEHMMEHGSLYGTDVIKGVLEKFYDCSLELLFQNRRIKLPGLGTLCLGLTSEGADSKDDFNVANITKARIYLLPDATLDQQLSGSKLAQRMHFANAAASTFVDLNTSEVGEGDGSEGGSEGEGNTEP